MASTKSDPLALMRSDPLIAQAQLLGIFDGAWFHKEFERAVEYVKRLDENKTLEFYFSGDGKSSQQLVLGQAGVPHLAFHHSESYGRLAVGGNKSGKSTMAAIECIMWARGAHPFRKVPKPPNYIRVVCEELPITMDRSHVQRDVIREWCPSHYLRGGSWDTAWSSQARTLHFENGSFIEFHSYNEPLQVAAGARRRAACWFDEEPPKDFWHENILRLDRKGAGWWLTYAPIGVEPWIERDLWGPATAKKLKGVESFTITMWDNAHNLPGGRDYIINTTAGWSDADVKTRVFGQYVRREGAVFDFVRSGSSWDPDRDWGRHP